MPAKKTKSKRSSSKFSRNQSKLRILLFVLAFAFIGSFLLWKSFAASGRIKVNAPAVAIANAGGDDKYWIATTDGGIFSEGGATFHGSAAGHRLSQPVTAMAARPQKDGYWLLGGDCGVFAFGAGYYGRYDQSAVNFCRAIVSTPSGNGYWLISRYGHIFKYGDAQSYSANIDAAAKIINKGGFGIIPGLPPNGIVAAARSVSGKGLILLAENGATYAYGDMPYHGNAPISPGHHATAIATDSNNGYLIAADDGAIYGMGSTYRGGANTIGHLNGPVIALAMTADNGGYWELGQDGGIFTYGNAKFSGNVDAPTYKTCWEGSVILSTKTCPPKKECWNQTFVTDLNKCPAKPVVIPPGGGGGNPGGGGGRGGGYGGCNSVCQLQQRLNAAGEQLVVDGDPGPLTFAACGRHPSICGITTSSNPCANPSSKACSDELARRFGSGGGGFGHGSGGGLNLHPSIYVSFTLREGNHSVCWTAQGPSQINITFRRTNYNPFGDSSSTTSKSGNFNESNPCFNFYWNSTYDSAYATISTRGGTGVGYATVR